MLLNYQYRCYLETPQKAQLNNWLRVAQYWYNWQLGDRFTWWETNRSNYIAPSGDCAKKLMVLKLIVPRSKFWES